MADNLTQTDIDYLRTLVGADYSDGVNNRIAYYDYLDSKGYQYGGLARGVVDSSTFSGRIANAFLATSASIDGNSINLTQASKISYELMVADFNARAAEVRDQGFSNTLPAIQHYENHRIVFENNGLNVGNWTAAEPIEYASENWQRLGYSSQEEAENAALDAMMDIYWGGDNLHISASTLWAANFLGPVGKYGPGWSDMNTWGVELSASIMSNFLYVTAGAGEGPYSTECFLPGTAISVGRNEIKPIDSICVRDNVLSYDQSGRLVRSRVSHVFSKPARQVLDIHGLMTTPGHVTLCADGPFSGQHVPVLDILRTDGAIVLEDGRKVRAGTGCPLDSEGDAYLTAVVGERTADGAVRVIESGRIRAGTRFILPDKTDVCVLDLIREAGGEIGEDGLVRPAGAGPETLGQPFRWPFTERLPKPEDYVLQRSATTLEDIFAANEWEAVGPQVPGPVGDRRTPKVNVPLSLRRGEPHGRFAPIAMRGEIEPVAHPEAAPAGTMLN